MRISDWSSDVCSSDLVQPVQARDAVRRLPAGQPLSRRRTEEARPVDAGDPRRDQAGRRLGAGPVAAARDAARDLPHGVGGADALADRRSDAQTSELQSLMRIAYAVYCLKKTTTREKR